MTLEESAESFDNPLPRQLIDSALALRVKPPSIFLNKFCGPFLRSSIIMLLALFVNWSSYGGNDDV